MQVCKARHRLHLPGATGSSVPSSANSHTLSPLAEPANTLPAEYATTYCLPLWPNTLTGAFMPAPVWNSQSFMPLLESRAAGRCGRAAVAGVGPMLLPHDLVRVHVERRERALRRKRIAAEVTADVELR